MELTEPMPDRPELTARISITEVIKLRVHLKRINGVGFKIGYCPFCKPVMPPEKQERVFVVCEDPGYFHCFQCRAHGDVVGFIMAMEGLAFPEALEKLAKLARLL